MKKDVDIGPIMAMMRSAYRAFFSRIVPNSWRKK